MLSALVENRGKSLSCVVSITHLSDKPCHQFGDIISLCLGEKKCYMDTKQGFQVSRCCKVSERGTFQKLDVGTDLYLVDIHANM